MNDKDLRRLALKMARRWGAREAMERVRGMARLTKISRATGLRLLSMIEADLRARLTKWETPGGGDSK